MLNIIQPVAILPEAAQAVIDGFAKAESSWLAASTPKPPPMPEPEKLWTIDAESGWAIVRVHGTLIAKRTPCMKAHPQLFSVTGCDELRQTIETVAADPKIPGIAFDVDSPGGQVTGIPEVAGMILFARTLKPCIAFTDGMACSAAYWIAAQCNAIFATPSAETGSIGVFMAFVDSSKKMSNDGYKVELFTTGALKGAGVTGTLTDAQREHYQTRVEEIFIDFKAAIRRRGIDAASMQGQTFYGKRAADARLVDGFALTASDAIRRYRNLTNNH